MADKTRSPSSNGQNINIKTSPRTPGNRTPGQVSGTSSPTRQDPNSEILSTNKVEAAIAKRKSLNATHSTVRRLSEIRNDSEAASVQSVTQSSSDNNFQSIDKDNYYTKSSADSYVKNAIRDLSSPSHKDHHNNGQIYRNLSPVSSPSSALSSQPQNNVVTTKTNIIQKNDSKISVIKEDLNQASAHTSSETNSLSSSMISPSGSIMSFTTRETMTNAGSSSSPLTTPSSPGRRKSAFDLSFLNSPKTELEPFQPPTNSPIGRVEAIRKSLIIPVDQIKFQEAARRGEVPWLSPDMANGEGTEDSDGKISVNRRSFTNLEMTQTMSTGEFQARRQSIASISITGARSRSSSPNKRASMETDGVMETLADSHTTRAVIPRGKRQTKKVSTFQSLESQSIIIPIITPISTVYYIT
jgi:hypothetical protein